MKRTFKGAFWLLNQLSITWQIIFLNLIFFLVSFISWIAFPDSLKYFVLIPENLIAGKYPWTLVTHMFCHSGFFHLFFNMFSLFFLGSFCEKIIGRKRFVWFYLISGVFAGLLAGIGAGVLGFGIGERIFGSANTAMLGASGAIFGVAGILSVIVPRKKVYLIAGPLIAIILEAALNYAFPKSAVIGLIDIFITVYIFVAIFSMFSFNGKIRKWIVPVELPFWLLPWIAIIPLVVIGLFVPLPIGNIAHFGGLVAGIAYGFYLRMKYANKVRMLERHFTD